MSRTAVGHCILCFFIGLMLMACEHTGGKTWDSERGILVDLDADFAMQFPDWGGWNLMDSTGSADVMFCAVNSTTGAAVMLCNLSDEGVSPELTETRALQHIDVLSRQGDNMQMIYADPVIAPAEYMGDNAYKFRRDILFPINGSVDTARIAYTGYIFDRAGTEYGFVITIPADIIDTYGDSALSEVFDGLRLD